MAFTCFHYSLNKWESSCRVISTVIWGSSVVNRGTKPIQYEEQDCQNIKWETDNYVPFYLSFGIFNWESFNLYLALSSMEIETESLVRAKSIKIASIEVTDFARNIGEYNNVSIS